MPMKQTTELSLGRGHGDAALKEISSYEIKSFNSAWNWDSML